MRGFGPRKARARGARCCCTTAIWGCLGTAFCAQSSSADWLRHPARAEAVWTCGGLVLAQPAMSHGPSAPPEQAPPARLTPPCITVQPARLPAEDAAVQRFQLPKAGVISSSQGSFPGPRVGIGGNVSAVPVVALILTKRLFLTQKICVTQNDRFLYRAMV